MMLGRFSGVFLGAREFFLGAGEYFPDATARECIQGDIKCFPISRVLGRVSQGVESISCVLGIF